MPGACSRTGDTDPRRIDATLCDTLTAIPAFAARQSLLVGIWEIDLSKLTMPGPKSVIIVFADAGRGKYKMTVDITDHDDTTRHAASTFEPDGTPVRQLGKADYDVVSMTMPSRRILVIGADSRAILSTRGSSRYPTTPST